MGECISAINSFMWRALCSVYQKSREELLWSIFVIIIRETMNSYYLKTVNLKLNNKGFAIPHTSIFNFLITNLNCFSCTYVTEISWRTSWKKQIIINILTKFWSCLGLGLVWSLYYCIIRTFSLLYINHTKNEQITRGLNHSQTHAPVGRVTFNICGRQWRGPNVNVL